MNLSVAMVMIDNALDLKYNKYVHNAWSVN